MRGDTRPYTRGTVVAFTVAAVVGLLAVGAGPAAAQFDGGLGSDDGDADFETGDSGDGGDDEFDMGDSNATDGEVDLALQE